MKANKIAQVEKGKFLVVKWENALCALDGDELVQFNAYLEKIKQYRAEQGKDPSPSYFVVNQDEPFAIKVLELIVTGGRGGIRLCGNCYMKIPPFALIFTRGSCPKCKKPIEVTLEKE